MVNKLEVLDFNYSILDFAVSIVILYFKRMIRVRFCNYQGDFFHHNEIEQF